MPTIDYPNYGGAPMQPDATIPYPEYWDIEPLPRRSPDGVIIMILQQILEELKKSNATRTC